MTPVDPLARPDLPDAGPVGPSSGITERPGESFDFFAPAARQHGDAPEAPAAPDAAAGPGAPAGGPAGGTDVPDVPEAPQLRGATGVMRVPGRADGPPLVPPVHFSHAGAPGEFRAAGVPDLPLPSAQDPPTLELGPPAGSVLPGAGAAGAGVPGAVLPGVELRLPAQHQPHPQPGAGHEAAGPLYVVGDVHGYVGELVTGLQAQGLIDADGHWSAGRARIWFLGDFTDRGPDGVGVIDLVMRLAAEAAAAGGYCRALMGNHELLLLGAERFADTPVHSSAGTASFLAAWRLNGGRQHDMDRLEEHHLAWLARLPAMAVEDGHLLVHSDTTAYTEYGSSVDEVNDAVRAVLQRADADEWWDSFRRLTKRFAFRGEAGPHAARELLEVFGGHRVVHGHSPIPYLLGEAAGEDDGHAAHQVKGPHVYADGLAVAMDGGVTMEGRLLIARLPLG